MFVEWGDSPHLSLIKEASTFIHSNVKVRGEQLQCGPKIVGFCSPVPNVFFRQSTHFLQIRKSGNTHEKMMRHGW